MSTSIQVTHNGETYAGEIMQIKSTALTVEDHGIVTAYLQCETKGAGVGIGGYSLDTPVTDADGKFLHREGTGFGLDHLMQIMRTVGVSSWEQLPGKYVVVLSSGKGGWGSTSLGIASLTGDRVFLLAEHAEQWRADHPEAVSA